VWRLKTKSGGRGRHYSVFRGLAESALTLAYARDWPKRVMERFPPRNRVQVREHRLPLLPGGRERRPVRVAFASDLHIGPLTPRRLLDEAFAHLASLAPDVLLLGGDYVYLEASEASAADLAARVASVPAPLKLAVLGNHDLWTRHELLEDALRAGGARVLVNEASRLPEPWGDVAVVGLDEPWTGAIDAERAFGEAADAALTIALVHAPEGYPFVRGRGARLLLCGHTHGGQVAMPSRPFVVHGPLGRRWPAGLYALPDLHLFVSRGLGAVELPLRLHAPPDVALFTLCAESAVAEVPGSGEQPGPDQQASGEEHDSSQHRGRA
jgi:predicted MPP superfamily phosphohydrolase